jgi:deoxyadenosine/deoxycytidine kinase
MAPLLVSLEGNIAAGKSSLLKSLGELDYEEDDFDLEIRPEPLDEWIGDDSPSSPINKFYKDPTKNFVEFQHFVLDTLAKRDQEPSRADMVLMERACGYSSFHVFIEYMRRYRNLNENEYKDFEDRYYLQCLSLPKPDLFVYLRTMDLDNAHKRLKERARKCEAETERWYLESLAKLHDEWLLRALPAVGVFVEFDTPVLTIMTPTSTSSEKIAALLYPVLRFYSKYKCWDRDNRNLFVRGKSAAILTDFA